MTTALVKIAKFADDDAWENPQTVGAGRELFYGRGALTLKPGAAVRIDHIKTHDVGRVLELAEFDHLDGRWVVAHIQINEPPEWLRRGTPASMTWNNLGMCRPMPGGWTLHDKGWVTEVSLLSPGHEPAEPGAKVTYLERTDPAKPIAPSPPALVAVAAPKVIRRDRAAERAAAETAELNRRLDWLEQHTGRPADTEAVIVGMQRELNGPSLDDLARDRLVHPLHDGIIRRPLGQVLGIR